MTDSTLTAAPANAAAASNMPTTVEQLADRKSTRLNSSHSS